MDIYERYDRQIMIFGLEGQKKLSNSSVAVVGAGGLGSPAILYLVAAGVGRMYVIDRDAVSISDLNRQILYTENDIGRKKADVVCERIMRLNSAIEVLCKDEEFNESNGREIVKDVDIVIDAVDNWETRYIINKLCVELKKPLVHAGIIGWYGQATTIIPGRTPCLSCIIPKPSPKKKIPVIGVTPGVLGVIEAAEAIKYLLGTIPSLLNKLLIVDLLYMEFRTVEIKRNTQCPVCGMLKNDETVREHDM
ncbi:MAG: HesA/MoeB/ThiF family protein [Ignisphaera sp.]|uniref:HesA/MoeB/ThiF family protein n=1 Tax=Ignisphaera aggregans TaxID=334771 RepID=A0A7J3MXB7_9CREN